MSIEQSGSRSSRRVCAGVSRRNFWKKLARQSGGTILTFDALQRGWVGAAQTASSKLEDIPRLDGTLELEGAVLQSFAFDMGVAAAGPFLFIALLQYLKPVLNNHDLPRAVVVLGGFQHQEALAVA